jgi:S1-C subfamily serine protease
MIGKRQWQFAANYRDLNNAEHSALQSNMGVCVVMLVDGSPAYNADVLVGEFIIAVDGQPVFGQQGLSELAVASRANEYRRFGDGARPPLLCLQHFTGTIYNWGRSV